jgi:hypothetical protein
MLEVKIIIGARLIGTPSKFFVMMGFAPQRTQKPSGEM